MGISEREIDLAQRRWGRAIVEIGTALVTDGDFRQVAVELVDRLYDYAFAPVLFKPTKASRQQFRLTRAGAISYFIGGDPAFPEDHGFALAPWRAVRFENAGIHADGGQAVAMGNYFFEPLEGPTIKVEYTFGYRLDEAGELRIHLHHSSLPFVASSVPSPYLQAT